MQAEESLLWDIIKVMILQDIESTVFCTKGTFCAFLYYVYNTFLHADKAVECYS